MFVSIEEARKSLGDLVSEVQAGGEVVLTRDGRAVVRLVTLDVPPPESATRRAAIEAAKALARSSIAAADTAARSEVSLYAEDGLPG